MSANLRPALLQAQLTLVINLLNLKTVDIRQFTFFSSVLSHLPLSEV